jgi:hypothetical protein
MSHSSVVIFATGGSASRGVPTNPVSFVTTRHAYVSVPLSPPDWKTTKAWYAHQVPNPGTGSFVNPVGSELASIANYNVLRKTLLL